MYHSIQNVIKITSHLLEVVNLSQAKPLSRVSQQNNISLESAIATILNASMEEISEILKQIPPEKTQSIVIAVILNSNVDEMTFVLKQLPTERTGDIALAIGQVWQGESD